MFILLTHSLKILTHAYVRTHARTQKQREVKCITMRTATTTTDEACDVVTVIITVMNV